MKSGPYKVNILPIALLLLLKLVKFWNIYTILLCCDIATKASTTSINYGVDQPLFTDLTQLMPTLCRNQTVICEGSYCIPGIRRCMCDLRQPVQLDKFCLRQVDIGNKCFATSQCNHTVKEAICLDISSNTLLALESSKFKLDQWHQLNDLRVQSKTSLNSQSIPQKAISSLINGGHLVAFYNLPIYSNSRTSPYEINYESPNLYEQNHTRRRTNSHEEKESANGVANQGSNNNETTTKQTNDQVTVITDTSTKVPEESTTWYPSDNIDGQVKQSTVSDEDSKISSDGNNNRQKAVSKTIYWPPGVCSCPHGFMFDPMIRKCLSLSLENSRCQVDEDCKQLVYTHCLLETKRCVCDEPFEWNKKSQACTRPLITSEEVNEVTSNEKQNFKDNERIGPIAQFFITKLAQVNPVMFISLLVALIFVFVVILKLITICFSTKSSILISPKNIKNKTYTTNTLSKHQPYKIKNEDSHLFMGTKETKGRILNYDFEQEDIPVDNGKSGSTFGTSQAFVIGTFKRNPKQEKTKTPNKRPKSAEPNQLSHKCEDFEQFVEDNYVSDRKATDSFESSVLNIPEPPPPTQQPPYMMSSTLRTAPSAIAAAAAAVANKRRMKNIDQNQSVWAEAERPAFL